jgi:hypothetical protein
MGYSYLDNPRINKHHYKSMSNTIHIKETHATEIGRANNDNASESANKKTTSPVYCHGFGFVATLESDTDDFEEVPLADIRKALLRRINSLTDDELREAVGYVQTFEAVR